ncbi:DUF5121 domain-containing protein [Prevotella sp. P6B1]|uniref:DUF5121 domain-containing protein n=1 Tax=Prevotella sp. P6B1 TaxID=1410613 RepID=UPI0009E0A5D2|nr:DUF5121 domain-containing protein [Prevotella sp. P6B1]
MKTKISQIGSMLLGAALCMLSSCINEDYKNIVQQGDPLIGISALGSVEMGQTVSFDVNCTDKTGERLSTLKAELLFTNESVDEVVIRTKEAGDYTVNLNVPFLQYIPNGDATVRLTLQNVTTSKTIVEVPLTVERPHLAELQFIADDGTAFDMTEGDDYLYTATINTKQNAFKGYFMTKDEKWSFGSNGSEIELGQKGNIDFVTNETGNVTVSFNICDYSYGPNEEISIQPLNFTESDNVMTRQLKQGREYTIGGIVNEDWFIDPDFFELNDDGNYVFRAIDGTYTLTAYNGYKFLQVYSGTADEPATLQADGSGAIWVIGGNGINKPYLNSSNNNGWWTGTEWDQATAQIKDKVYQLTLTVGKQLSATDINFKFFGQPAWGVEFKGDGSEKSLVCNSDVFGVGDGNGHDNGNIYLKEGVTLNEGDTYIFTIDLTGGTQNAPLTIKKGAGEGTQLVTLADKDPQIMSLKKGMTLQFDGIVNNDWYIDPDFLKANGDGTYTFLCINGQYAIKAYADYQYVQVYPVNDEGKPATLQADGTGSVWIIGSDCVNKPFLNSGNNKSWWTDPDWDQCMAPIAKGKYRITLTVGQQLKASDINFKFFGQPTWGIEFNGKGGEYHLDSDNDWFRVNAADSDNGNIFLKDGVTLTEGDIFEFTIDLSAGIANGILNVEKK